MPTGHVNPVYSYRRSSDQDANAPVHHAVVVVGAGPAGLTAAIELSMRGHAVVLLDDNDTVSVGSRAICFSKRTLEIWDRCGCAEPMLERGVQWRIGKVFFDEDLVYEFNLQPELGHRMPAFINLQQYYVEEILVARAEHLGVDLRWRHKVIGLEQGADVVQLRLATPDGEYTFTAGYVIAADGASSEVRGLMGLTSDGQVFNDQFLIADIVMHAPFPTERWFWFDPPFHRNQSVLLHRQADNVFRVDFQLGVDADANDAQRVERIAPRIRAMLGADVQWTLDWTSVYTFRCRMMNRFTHGRVLFVGDAAHQVSPFGARGANGGVQGVSNLTWKLSRVLHGLSPETLLESYDAERIPAARENVLHSTRATDFITPKSRISRVFRDSALRLARRYPFARALINSGRLSTPYAYTDSPLNTPDATQFEGGPSPGNVCPDAPVRCAGRNSWLLNVLGPGFTLLAVRGAVEDGTRRIDDLTVLEIGTDIEDTQGLVAARYGMDVASAYLIRPDQHVCARWRAPQAVQIRTAMRCACGLGAGAAHD